MHEEDIAALLEPVLDVDESIYLERDIEFEQGEFDERGTE
jgi:hypothetical protein